jgi:hypothetical protein
VTSDPGVPTPAPEPVAVTYLRYLGAIGLVIGLILGLWLGGRWWFIGPGIFVGTALIAAAIQIASRDLGKRHRR